MALDFRDSIVAGGSKDFAEVHHLFLRGSNREIGRKLAEIARQRHNARPMSSQDALVTRCRNNYFRKNYPAHYERMRGAAEASGIKMPGDTVNVGEIWYDLDIAPGCSVIFYPPAYLENGHGVLSRNYDFGTGPPELMGRPARPGATAATAHPYLIEVYPDQGIPALYMCAYDLLGGCIDGINAHGLTVALLADDETASKYPIEPVGGSGVGLNEINVMRMLLDTCSDVEDAKQALLEHKHYYSVAFCHYIIGDRHGQSFVWEYSHAHNREYITDGGAQPQIITNHPVHKYRSMDELPHEDDQKSSTYTRFRTLKQRLEPQQARLSLDTIKETQACVAMTRLTLPAESRPGPTRTLWHAIYDCQEKSVEISFYLGEDPTASTGTRRSPYQRFHLNA